jgi:hypothetical protein
LNPKFVLCIQTCETFFSSLFVNDPEAAFTFVGLAFFEDVEGRLLSVRYIWVCNTSLFGKRRKVLRTAVSRGDMCIEAL